MRSTPPIREAAASDAPLIARMISRSFKDVADRFELTPENAPSHPSNCTPEWVEKDFRRGKRYFFLECDGEPRGCVAMEQAGPEVCYLERLAVLPEYRGNGLGSALVERVADESRRLGAERLEIAIIAEHGELRRWYEKLGFVAAADRRFPHLPFGVTFMSRSLQERSSR